MKTKKKVTPETRRAQRRAITARWRAKVKKWLWHRGYTSLEAYITAQMIVDPDK